MVVEENFPRGKVVFDKDSTKPPVKAALDDEPLFQTGKKRKASRAVKNDDVAKKKSKKAKIAEERGVVWMSSVKMDMYVEGLKGCGIVHEVEETFVLLDCVDGVKVELPATNIGKTFLEALKSDKISLEEAFPIGMMVPFKVARPSVVQPPKKKGGKSYRTRPIVECAPGKLNAQYTMHPGLTIFGVVESLEEKGAILDVGFSSVKGFLPRDKAGQIELKEGLPLAVRVESVESRTLKVSALVEQGNLSFDVCETLKMECLLPGTIVECTPEVEQKLSKTKGIFVNLGNDVRGFIHRRHLPPRIRKDPSRLGKAIRAVVMLCQKNTHLLVLSAHPDLIAVSRPERRTQFQNYQIGDVIECTVMELDSKSPKVTFMLPDTEDGKASLITATAFKSFLDKADERDKIYKTGKNFKCRVMDFNYVERTLIVATRKDILKQKIICWKNATPGELVDAKVKMVGRLGVKVIINNLVPAFIPTSLCSEKTAFNLVTAFPIEKTVKCRIWDVNEENKNIVLATRSDLVKFEGAPVGAYDANLIGSKTVVLISKVLPTGSLIVKAFGRVTGIVHGSHVKRKGMTSEIKVNQTLPVTVAEVNPEERRMRFDLIGEDIVQEKKQEKSKAQPEKSKKTKPEKEKPIKRPLLKPEEDSEQEEEKPKKKAESVKISDPGFDWSDSGFRPEDFVEVGKVGELEDDEELIKKTGLKMEKPEQLLQKDEMKGKSRQELDRMRAVKIQLKEMEVGKTEPKTEDDYSKLVRKEHNSAEAWIRFMSYFLEKDDLVKARITAERALSSINYREEDEIFNIWTAYLNMEVTFGDEQSARTIFERACGNADSLRVHKQYAAILVRHEKQELADEIFDAMVRKFRSQSDEVWHLQAENLMNTSRQAKARDLLKRALDSVPKARHSSLISKFAQLEYKKGDPEKGKTMFENLLIAYPKKTDIWMIYANLALKQGGIQTAREVLSRACGQKLSIHKLRPLFKLWMELEEKHGDEKSRREVQNKAIGVLKEANAEEEEE
ncbi:hypothetical protein WR25_19035 [Diploscapter pachys]|uniref:S1 motif domain-containing protein n=1 Tax=Diploscapter pachys TaxID=2018661 RepID=A0A2A2JJJ7_9BILA|nr:hypothetical protein WR25_19035 [Diploscapter pachys]